MLKKSIFIGAGIFLFGCTAIGPDYQKPETKMPENYSANHEKIIKQGENNLKEWWTLFNDPMLNELIIEAEKDNYSIKIALAKVLETRYQLASVTGDRYPQLNGTGSAYRQKLGNDINGGTGNTGAHGVFSTGLNASWEIDVFGRVRRNVQAATALYDVSAEDYNAVKIALFAEVARNYLTMRSLQAQIFAVENNIKSQEQVLDITRKRFENGLVSDLDVALAERVLATSQSTIPGLKIAINKSMNTLGFLLGKTPSSLIEKFSTVKEVPLPKDPAIIGFPAELLRQRPDILRAERNLEAQMALIGVNKAELYPQFSLDGSINYTATDFGNLFHASGRAISYGPSFKWNIFNGGKIKNLVKKQDAVTLQALYTYEQAVISALSDVEIAINSYIEQLVQFELQKKAMNAAQRGFKLAMSRYKEGLSDFQYVLDSQQALLQTENNVAAARGQTAVNLVALYQAVGGGWDFENKEIKMPSEDLQKNELKTIIKE